MNNRVNIISTGNVKVNTQSITRSSVKVQQNQQGDFSQTLDQAQQARSKNDSQSYSSRTEDARRDNPAQEAAAKEDNVPENEVQEKSDAVTDADKSQNQSHKAGEKQGPVQENENKGEAADEAAAQNLAAAAEASINMVQELPLAELTTYFKAGYGENSPVQQAAADTAMQPQDAQALNQLMQGDGQQPVDALEAVNIMEAVQPVEGDTQNASARTPSVKAQQANSYAPSSIEALLGNSKLQNQQGAGGIVQQDNGQQMLNLLAGRQVYTQPVNTEEMTWAENTVNISQLADLTGTVEVVNPTQGQQSFAGAGENSTQQQSMSNSQGQQQASQMAGEAAFDVVLPGDESQQDNTMGQNNVQAMGFQQTLDGIQNGNVQNVGQSQQTNQTQETYNVSQQIVDQAKLLQRGTDTEMIIKLNPEHLGQLSLKVSVNGNGGVTATFHTDNAQVRAILENTMVQLKQQLNEQGIKVDNVDVQTGLPDGQLPQDQGQQGFYQGQQGQQVRSTQVDLKDFEETTEALAAEPVEAQAESQDVILDSQGNQISTGVNYTV